MNNRTSPVFLKYFLRRRTIFLLTHNVVLIQSATKKKKLRVFDSHLKSKSKNLARFNYFNSVSEIRANGTI